MASIDKDEIIPVILSGGGGTRLWPRSRTQRPKPFLNLIDGGTLFEQTLARVSHAPMFSPPIIVTGEPTVGLVKEQARQLQRRLIVEPELKNTAASIALAAAQVAPDAIMLVCPSDHRIGDVDAFHSAVRDAALLARQNWLVCLAADARAPETGYGYLQRGDPLEEAGFRVRRFVEKPSKAIAQSYVADGGYAWNTGIFVLKAGAYLAELERHRPSLAAAVQTAVSAGKTEGNAFFPDRQAFSTIEPESADYAVFENTDRAAMVVTDMGWSDVGTWAALHDICTKDQSGNCLRGPAEAIDSRNNLIDSDGPRIIAIGVEDLVIVVDGSDVLIAHKDRSAETGQFSRLGKIITD